jgi:hypothetical protein
LDKADEIFHDHQRLMPQAGLILAPGQLEYVPDRLVEIHKIQA